MSARRMMTRLSIAFQRFWGLGLSFAIKADKQTAGIANHLQATVAEVVAMDVVDVRFAYPLC